uniref:Endonuclease/exonuclease/phosphatase domain-containing protein n=1 Tax=Scylla olivacea TaxID=85551 RepID=A0A0P4VYJ0_SCYOL
MINNTIVCMKRLVINSENIILMGDFNCKEVSWENWSSEGSELSWENKLLQLVMDNILMQLMKDSTRLQGNEEPARLDLVFTKEPGIVEDMTYQSPFGKSDHVLTEFMLGVEGIEEEDHKEGH